jgi:hypothetical protein
MSEPTGVVSHLTGAFVDGVPRYLLTIVEYIAKRPRRFFLQYELEPQRYIAPWPFLLINALLTAGLAQAVDRMGDSSSPAWNWTLYWKIVPAGFVTHFLVVGCGALAAVLTRQRITLNAMMTAFAYASVWVLVYVPALAATGEFERHSAAGTAYLSLAIFSELCHIVYLVSGFVRLNYLAGRRAVGFVILTFVLTGVGSAATLLVITHLWPGAHEADATVTEQELNEAVSILRSNYKITTDEQFEASLRASGLSSSELRAQLRDEIVKNRRIVNAVLKTSARTFDSALPANSMVDWLHQLVGNAGSVSHEFNDDCQIVAESSAAGNSSLTCLRLIAHRSDGHSASIEITVNSSPSGVVRALRVKDIAVHRDGRVLHVEKLSEIARAF